MFNKIAKFVKKNREIIGKMFLVFVSVFAVAYTVSSYVYNLGFMAGHKRASTHKIQKIKDISDDVSLEELSDELDALLNQ